MYQTMIAALSFIIAAGITAHQLDCPPRMVQGESQQPAATAVRPITPSLVGKVASIPLPRIIAGRAIRCEAGVCATAERVRRLDFTRSAYAMPPDALAGLPPVPAWTLYAAEAGFSSAGQVSILRAAERHQRADVDMGTLAYAVARFESHGYQKCRYPRRGGKPAQVCIGMFQFKPLYWADDFQRAGLDIYSGDGQAEMFMQVIEAKLDAGVSLRAALQPWAVRSKALRLYHTILD